MTTHFYTAVLCLAVVLGTVASSSPENEQEVKEVATEDLKDLLYVSMRNIVSLNDLVTELSEKIAHLTISSASISADVKMMKADSEVAKTTFRKELENLQKEVSKISDDLKDVESSCKENCNKDEGPWECYHYTESDRAWRTSNKATQKQMCENVQGGKFTAGKNDRYPECGSCWCCQDQSVLAPLDGGWSRWGDWSECTAKCGGGSQSRNRTCTEPAPAHGGLQCEGGTEETRECGSEPCPDYTMSILCDDVLTVFVDGAERRVDGLDRWNVLSTMKIPSSTELIAVKCFNAGGGYGIVGSVQNAQGDDVLVTDNSWKCSKRWESGWTLPGFEEGENWKAAADLGDGHFMMTRTDGGWYNVPSSKKRPIWTSSGSDTTVYCRKTVQ